MRSCFKAKAKPLLTAAALLLVLAGCSSSKPYTLAPVKTADPDRQPFETPEETQENQYWDRVDLTVFYQLEKPLDLNWTGRQLGRALGVAEKREADDVNALGEPPNSSWFTRRHFYHEMTPQALARGPSTTGGPDASAPWTVVSGKFEGASSGFVIEDARGDRYLLKFGSARYPKTSSAAEVVATKIFYAAGYNVPQNYAITFDPARLRVGAGAEVRLPDGGRRAMTAADVRAIVEELPQDDRGAIRALASKYVDGRPYGPWNFRGTREDDPNDRVRHEHRRELRGLRVLSAWLNDADRRAANTLAVYTDEKYFRHYLIDFGSTMGANGRGVHRPIHGQAYLIDPRYIAASTLALGLYERPWTDYDPAPRYPSVGYFRADVFKPGRWVPTYPNPAFQKMTLRDAFWGAKLVMSFTDADLRAIVETGKLGDPAAADYLVDMLAHRRDATGRHWFSKVNPLDRFRVDASSAAAPVLRFDDLMVEGKLAPAGEAAYDYTIRHGGEPIARGTVAAPAVPLRAEGGASLAQRLAGAAGDGRVVEVTLHTRRAGGKRSKATRVWVHFPEDGAAPRIAGVRRAV